VKLLLDTHAFIWADSAPEKLSARAAAACRDHDNQLFLSVASVWELQIKLMLGKVTLHHSLRKIIEDWCRRTGLVVVEARLEHVLRLDSIPPVHKDPFDRLLVAQAFAEDYTIVTHDKEIARYPVAVLW
jgi:PIN domain nuclease of toxin-antitoxin system